MGSIDEVKENQTSISTSQNPFAMNSTRLNFKKRVDQSQERAEITKKIYSSNLEEEIHKFT